MYLLGIESSTKSASISIYNDKELIADFTINDKVTHSQRLMPILQSLLNITGIKINDIGKIVVDIGPGSFTGIRIALATAKSIAHVRDIKIVEINSLEGLAFANKYEDVVVVPMIDAQRTNVYASIFDFNNDGIKYTEPEVVDIDELISHIKNEYQDRKVIAIGEGAKKYREIIEENKINLGTDSQSISRASGLIEASFNLEKIEKSCYEVMPLYIRKSQAEIQYENKL